MVARLGSHEVTYFTWHSSFWAMMLSRIVPYITPQCMVGKKAKTGNVWRHPSQQERRPAWCGAQQSHQVASPLRWIEMPKTSKDLSGESTPSVWKAPSILSPATWPFHWNPSIYSLHLFKVFTGAVGTCDDQYIFSHWYPLMAFGKCTFQIRQPSHLTDSKYIPIPQVTLHSLCSASRTQMPAVSMKCLDKTCACNGARCWPDWWIKDDHGILARSCWTTICDASQRNMFNRSVVVYIRNQNHRHLA